MLPILPDWFVKLTPEGFMPPERAREFYIFTLNVIPWNPPSVTTVVNQELVLSKRADVAVFGGMLTFTNAPAPGGQPTFFNPRGGISTGLMCKLGNPAGNEIFTSDFVPMENLFSAWGAVGDAIAFNGVPAGQPAIWPIPITVFKGGSLLLTITQSRTDTINAGWIRLSFWCALLSMKGRKAA